MKDKYTVQHWNGEKWCNDRLKLDYEQAKEYAREHKQWAEEHWGPTPHRIICRASGYAEEI